MLLVPVESLRSGMALAMPVLHPERDDLTLLQTGYNLDDSAILHMRQFGVTHVWVSFPGLDELDEHASPRVNLGHMELLRVLNRSVDDLERRVSVKVNVHHYKRAVHHMLGEIVANPDHDPVTNQLAACGPSLAGHLANTAYLSLLIGAHLAGYLRNQRRSLPPDLAENTAQLGMGALLHDIGKVSMPEEFQSRCILDPEAQWPEYRNHVKTGYDEVRDHVSPVAANVVLHHHQRYDGSGFPRKKSLGSEVITGFEGSRIHVFSRIVAAVDVFDHLLCPAGKPVPTVIALHAIRGERFKGWFDPVVLAALCRLVPAFMVGSLVTLSDGSTAAVVHNHPEAPCRPTVRVLNKPVDAQGARASRQLDLRLCRDLSIAAVEGVDVRKCLYLGEFETPSLDAGLGAVFEAA
ncbi:MAG: HD domain-containing protein [Planctomycetes bacterium]|nr:HD domain-containing protein [Planctomycetota bacterium]